MSCCCEERLERRRGFFRRRLYYVPSSSIPALLLISTAAAKRQCSQDLLLLVPREMFGTPVSRGKPATTERRLGFYKGGISLTAAPDAMQMQDKTKGCSTHNFRLGHAATRFEFVQQRRRRLLNRLLNINRRSNSAPAMSSVTAGRPAENVHRR